MARHGERGGMHVTLVVAVGAATIVLIAQRGGIEASQTSDTLPGVLHGEPFTSAPGTYMTTRDLMRLAGPHTANLDASLPSRAPSVSQDRAPVTPALDTSVLPTAQQVGLTFTAFTGAGVPDTMGAVGPTQYLTVINQGVRSFSKATGQPDGVLDLSLPAFFQAVRGNAGVFDPIVKFDRLSGRWVVTAATTSPRFVIAVSADGAISPVGGWTFFSLQQDQLPPAGDTGCSTDMPNVGIDANAVYVAMGLLAPCNRGLGLVIRKDSLLHGGPVQGTVFRNAILGQPMDNPDPAATDGYFFYGWTHFNRVVNPGGAAAIVQVPMTGNPVPFGTGLPFAIRHKGNVNESGSSTVYNTAQWTGRMWTSSQAGLPIRNGHAWITRVVGVDNAGVAQGGGNTDPSLNTRVGLLWAEVAGLNTSQASVVRSGIVYSPTAVNDVHQRNYWMPSLNVSGQGHLVVGGSAAGTNEYINGVAAGALADDPPGSLRIPVVFTASAAPYNAPLDPSRFNMRRWGDYSATSVDPCDDMTIWTTQQFTSAPDRWGIQVAKVLAPPPATPSAVVPNTLQAATPSTALAVSGLRMNGSGFFDPGPGFACRISARLDGGVRVNRVAYLSPTSLTLDVSTSCAANGTHALTIVNPDGQSITLPAALTTNILPAPVRTAPGAPTLVGSATGTAVSLAWTPAASACEASTFTLEAGSAPGASDLFVGAMGAATHFDSPAPRGVYYVRVRGTNDVGTGPPSNEVTVFVGVTPPPGPPTGLVGSASGQTVSFGWQPPASGGAVQSYLLEAGSGPGRADIAALPLGGSPASFQAAGVPPGIYFVRVRAVNAGGTSGPSNEVTVTVSSAVPGAPTALSASVGLNRQVSFTWTAPASGGAVTGYRLDAGSGPGLSNLAVLSLTASPTAFLVANVPPGTYFVRVVAVNAFGPGVPSNEVVVVVP